MGNAFCWGTKWSRISEMETSNFGNTTLFRENDAEWWHVVLKSSRSWISTNCIVYSLHLHLKTSYSHKVNFVSWVESRWLSSFAWVWNSRWETILHLRFSDIALLSYNFQLNAILIYFLSFSLSLSPSFLLSPTPSFPREEIYSFIYLLDSKSKSFRGTTSNGFCGQCL